MTQSPPVLGAGTAPDATGSRPGSDTVRHDIQALRAIAVSSVVLFHLWPSRLPGGYVGVDVFFVISGFLITGHLLREISRTGRVSLPSFWAKRATRLLPSSLTVLLATVVTTILVVPTSLWQQFLGEAISSTWYVENWALANKAVDYLAADAAPSPEQHFWSLSVEEQFYIGTPILLVVLVLVAARFGSTWRRPVLAGLAAVALGSFVYGVWLTSTSAPTAYFSTFTRAWEFAVGALVSLAPGMLPGRRTRVFAWLGIAAIVVTCFIYSPRTAFPGYAALLPVLATALVILARDVHGRGSVGYAGELTVPAFLGRTSYSIYLWHWPLIVLLPFVTGVALNGLSKTAIIVVTLVLAYVMTKYVEEPVRFSPRLLGGGRRPRFVAMWSIAAMLLVTGAAAGGMVVNNARDESLAKASAAVVAEHPDCFGAAAMATPPKGCPNPKLDGVLVPNPAVASNDSQNRVACWAGLPDPKLHVCTVGPTTGYTRHLFAVGDSHNNALIPAYAAMAKAHNWRIDVAGHNGCYWSNANQLKSTDAFTVACADWVSAVNSYLASHTEYDAVLTTYGYSRSVVAVDQGSTSDATTARGIHEAWAPIVARGTPVIAIRDVPVMRDDVTTCVEKYRLAGAQACASPRGQALADFNGLAAAVAQTPGSSLVDLTQYFCDARTCMPVIGHVTVYVDHDHITATFATTLAPFLGQDVAKLLKR